MVGVVGAGELDTRHVREKRRIAGSGGAAALEDLRELLELGEADRCAHVVEPVVEAETSVLEPAAGIGASLVAEAAEEPPLLLGVGRDHPPLTGRHLLVRVEGEDGRRAVRAHERATVDRAECLAGVLDQRQAVAVADPPKLFELARVAVDVDRDDRLRSLGHGSFDERRVEVHRRCPQRLALLPGRWRSSRRRRTSRAR